MAITEDPTAALTFPRCDRVALCRHSQLGLGSRTTTTRELRHQELLSHKRREVGKEFTTVMAIKTSYNWLFQWDEKHSINWVISTYNCYLTKNQNHNHTWWITPLSKWVSSPQFFEWINSTYLIYNWGELTHLLSGMSHQVMWVKQS